MRTVLGEELQTGKKMPLGGSLVEVSNISPYTSLEDVKN